MKILAFDTSSTALSVALLEDENLVAESTVTVKKNHSISLMPTIDFLVAQAGWQPADLERIVVAQGPGSYTGLRVAVATAKTLAYALGIDLVGVSSLQALTDLTADGIVIRILVEVPRGIWFVRSMLLAARWVSILIRRLFSRKC